MKRSPLTRTSPMTRQPMKHRPKRSTAAEMRAYQMATERARDEEGTIRCEVCRRGLIQGAEQRHHRIPRSRGGRTADPAGLIVCCAACHDRFHHLRTHWS